MIGPSQFLRPLLHASLTLRTLDVFPDLSRTALSQIHEGAPLQMPPSNLRLVHGFPFRPRFEFAQRVQCTRSPVTRSPVGGCVQAVAANSFPLGKVRAAAPSAWARSLRGLQETMRSTEHRLRSVNYSTPTYNPVKRISDCR